MSKRLKKRIQELCGLTNLSREDKARRAKELLSDNDEKQRICNELLGTKFKDIEKTLQDIVDSKKFSSREQDEEEEILSYAPEKIHGPTKPTMAKSVGKVEYLLDPEEVAFLIEASTEVIEVITSEAQQDWHSTYSMEEVWALMEGTYDPSHFARRR